MEQIKTTTTNQKALALIASYFGHEAELLYEKFYKDKDEETVRESIKELMNEYLGEDKAKKEYIKVFGEE